MSSSLAPCFSGCVVDKYHIKFTCEKGATWEEVEAAMEASWGDPAYHWRGFGKPGDEDFVVVLTRRYVPEEKEESDEDEEEDEDEDEGADSTDEDEAPRCDKCRDRFSTTDNITRPLQINGARVCWLCYDHFKDTK